LTTAVWLARVLRRPLKVCDDLNGIIALPRATSAQCAQWTKQFHDKQFKYNLSMTQNDTMFVGCHQSAVKFDCSNVRTGFPGSDPSKSRRVSMITRDLYRHFWSNADFLSLMNASHRVVLSINRNAVSFLSKTMNREILHSVLRIQRQPLYENCLHFRSYRMHNLDAHLECTGIDPVMVFSDLNSRHLHINDGKKGTNRTFTDSIQGFLRLSRCKRMWIGSSSFGVAAALASTADYKDIRVFQDANDCHKQKEFLDVRSTQASVWGRI